MAENETGMRFLTRDAIKYLAIVAMTLDHIAYVFLESNMSDFDMFIILTKQFCSLILTFSCHCLVDML